MRKTEIYKLQVLILAVSLVLSTDLFWNFISLLKYETWYITFQFIFASFYFNSVIIVTGDIVIFQDFWNRHRRFKIGYEKVLHICSVIIVKTPIVLMHIIDIIFNNINQKGLDEDKEIATKKLMEMDKMPLVVKSILLPGTIALFWMIIIQLGGVNETINKWIGSFLDFAITILNFLFIVVAVKEWKLSTMIDENTERNI